MDLPFLRKAPSPNWPAIIKPPLTMLGKTSTPTDFSPRAFAPGFSLYSLSRVALASRSMVALLAANETLEATILIARVSAETAKNNLSIALGILNWLRLQLNFIIILLTIHNLRRSSIRDQIGRASCR